MHVLLARTKYNQVSGEYATTGRGADEARLLDRVFSYSLFVIAMGAKPANAGRDFW